MNFDTLYVKDGLTHHLEIKAFNQELLLLSKLQNFDVFKTGPELERHFESILPIVAKFSTSTNVDGFLRMNDIEDVIHKAALPDDDDDEFDE